MKQIRSILLENFQSHVRSKLEFGPGLNVITGPSDSGKSAVLRALRWVLYNEPRGSDFVRRGARECRVTVTMSDGAQILRELILAKSGNVQRNRYLLTPPGGEAFAFEGFGAEVPLEVRQAHGMVEVALDTDKQVVLNFASQLEGPFLMAETGSVRARAIGRLLGVHVVDAAIRDVAREVKAGKAEITRLERELARLEGELAPFQALEEQEERLERAEALLAQAEAEAARLAELTRLRQEQAQLAEGIAAERRALEQARRQLAAGLDQHAALLKQMGHCPTCLQPLSPEAVEQLASELGAVHLHEGSGESHESGAHRPTSGGD